MTQKLGLSGQIIAMFIVVAVTMSALLFFNIRYVHVVHEKQVDQALEMIAAEKMHEDTMLTASRDKKIEMLITIMKTITPDLILSYDLMTLESFSRTFGKDPDISSITFYDAEGAFLAGDKTPEGGKTISHDIGTQGAKHGRIVIGVNTALLKQNLFEVDQRINSFKQRASEEDNRVHQNLFRFTLITFGIFIVIIFITALVVKNIIGPVKKLSAWTKQVAEGDLDSLDIKAPDNEIGELKTNFTRMVDTLRESAEENRRNDRLKTGMNGLNNKLRGVLSVEQLAKKGITFVADFLQAPVGALYIKNSDGLFTFSAGHAVTQEDISKDGFGMGEGFIGQAAQDKKLLVVEQVPPDYLPLSSGLGSKGPATLLALPLVFNETTVGVLELGFFTEFTEFQKDFFKEAATPFAIAVNSAISRMELQKSLEKSQQLAEEMQVQQEELRVTNEELEEQAKRLQASEEELQQQQEELRTTNEELEEKSSNLQERQKELFQKNRELEKTRQQMETKAEDLEIAGKYKSEFLANMSHELRTPLNSLLILAQDLTANRPGNLDADQVESAQIIYQSGHDLLNLINDILDLSKIEAGKMTLSMDEVSLDDSIDWIMANFNHVVQDKGLALHLEKAPDLPKFIKTDFQRLHQILKNLIANAIKFTEKGSIRVQYGLPAADVSFTENDLNKEQCVAISVSDTGTGIPADKLTAIFEAFQQADGSTSRMYGGTGLGLSISMELSKLLGGELRVASKVGEGSVFTVYLPLVMDRRQTTQKLTDRRKKKVTATLTPVKKGPEPPPAPSPAPSIDDDRQDIQADDKTILIIEDDCNFATVLGKLCHERLFKFIHAGDGETGLKLTGTFKPDAIILDLKLPGIQGWTVLDILKNQLDTRHIPVHIMSVEEKTIEAFQRGAIGFLNKPVDKKELDQAFAKITEMTSGRIRRLLIVEDDLAQQKSIITLIGNNNVETIAVVTATKALEKLESEQFDCMILDLKLPDMTGFDLLKKLDALQDISVPPIIIYTGKEISHEEEEELQKYASSVIVKGVRSPERLLDETALFLHQMVENLPQDKQKMVASLHDPDIMFHDKKILLVDDDMRNVFALSKVLTDMGLEVLKAGNGRDALDILAKDPGIDLVLMDIMMPVMDGYEAMGHIRAMADYRDVPILALTAKAMKEDRLKCIEAGANEYLAKPVDVNQLLSLLRVWMYR